MPMLLAGEVALPQRRGAPASRSTHARSAACMPVCGAARRRQNRVVRPQRSSETLQAATESPPLALDEQRIRLELALAVETMGERVVDPQLLRSTPKQRAIVSAWWLLNAVCGGEAALQVAGGDAQAAAVAVAALGAYLAADLGSGVFHFFVDNYGDKDTPVLGTIIDAFQGHHKYPRTIVQRDYCNNVAGLCAPQLAPLLLLAALPVGASAHVFWSLFAVFTAMSQQTHAWSHSLRSELPGPVVALQEAGVIIGRKAHGAHHRPPFQGNYCIVSGLFNPLLDAPWALPTLEQLIFRTTGVAPRCWADANEGVEWPQVEEEVLG